MDLPRLPRSIPNMKYATPCLWDCLTCQDLGCASFTDQIDSSGSSLLLTAAAVLACWPPGIPWPMVVEVSVADFGRPTCGPRTAASSQCWRNAQHDGVCVCGHDTRRVPQMFEKKLHRHRPQIEKVGTDGSQLGNQRLPWQGTAGSQTLKRTGNQRLPLQGIAGSQKLEFMCSKLSNYHCKELRIPKV